jgi:hypothetical protein
MSTIFATMSMTKTIFLVRRCHLFFCSKRVWCFTVLVKKHLLQLLDFQESQEMVGDFRNVRRTINLLINSSGTPCKLSNPETGLRDLEGSGRLRLPDF